MSTNKEAKKRYFKRVYEEAENVECLCGCGTIIKSKDRFGRDKKYVSGHNGRKYTDPSEHKRAWNHRNREARYLYKKKFIRDRKIKLINLSGSKCLKCEYEFDGSNEIAFDFHHRNPSEKLFALNQSSINRFSWDKLTTELSKCDLLCARCHRLEHNNY